MRVDDVRRLDLGTFVRPAGETGTGLPRVEAVYGYAIPHPTGLVVLDTGLGQADEETEAWYRPQRVPLEDALRAHGLTSADVQVVVNCHLHFDHVGGNATLPGRAIVCQRRELAAAGSASYTIASLIDFPGARYELLDGEAEIVAGVHVVPTLATSTVTSPSSWSATMARSSSPASRTTPRRSGAPTSSPSARPVSGTSHRCPRHHGGWPGCSRSTRDGSSSRTTRPCGCREAATMTA